MDDQLALQDASHVVSTTAIVIVGRPIIVSVGTLLALLQFPGPSAVLVAGLKVFAILLPFAGGVAQSVVTYASSVATALVTFATRSRKSLLITTRFSRADADRGENWADARRTVYRTVAYCITILWLDAAARCSRRGLLSRTMVRRVRPWNAGCELPSAVRGKNLWRKRLVDESTGDDVSSGVAGTAIESQGLEGSGGGAHALHPNGSLQRGPPRRGNGDIESANSGN